MATYASAQALNNDVSIDNVLDIQIYALASQELLYTLSTATDFTIVATFSPDSSLLATAHGNGLINLWDMTTGERIKTLYGPFSGTSSLLFAQDGRLLISKTNDRLSHYLFWDLSSFNILGIMTHRFDSLDQYRIETDDFNFMQMSQYGHVASILSPDEKQMVTAAQDGTIWLWDLETPTQNPTMLLSGEEMPNFPIRSLYSLPDSQSILFYFNAGSDVIASGLYQLNTITKELELLTDEYDINAFNISDNGDIIVWGNVEDSSITFAQLTDLENTITIELDTDGRQPRLWTTFGGEYFQFIEDDTKLIVGGFLNDDFYTESLYIVDVPTFED
jgi:WD40 repeat protein